MMGQTLSHCNARMTFLPSSGIRRIILNGRSAAQHVIQPWA
jgi:hypothetical protein